MTGTRISQADAQLQRAMVAVEPCDPVRTLIGDDLSDAYAVQHRGITRRIAAGARQTGRKVGLTSLAVQQQLGVDEPDFGVLLDDMSVIDGRVPSGSLISPRIEAEIAFILEEDIFHPEPARVERAVGFAVPALEIVDSRIREWDISIIDTVADNASSALYVLGDARIPLTKFTPAQSTMTLRKNGEVVSEGSGADCLGDPLRALTWVANKAADLGQPLQAGEVVLSGAMGAMTIFAPGDEVEAIISGLGSVSARMD